VEEMEGEGVFHARDVHACFEPSKAFWLFIEIQKICHFPTKAIAFVSGS